MPALADKFSNTPLAAVSPEGQYVVKTVVKQDGVNHFAHVYKLDEDMDYQRISEFKLVDSMFHPTEIMISESGNTFTASTKMGKSQLIGYSQSGAVLKSYSLNDLFTAESIELLKRHRSVSNDHWMCLGFKPWINGDTLIIKDSIGGYFSVDTDTAEFMYQTDRRPCPLRN